MFDSFLQYQGRVAAKFKELQATYGFTILDGLRSPEEIHVELRRRIAAVLTS
jgi:thymidylate kinase